MAVKILNIKKSYQKCYKRKLLCNNFENVPISLDLISNIIFYLFCKCFFHIAKITLKMTILDIHNFLLWEKMNNFNLRWILNRTWLLKLPMSTDLCTNVTFYVKDSYPDYFTWLTPRTVSTINTASGSRTVHSPMVMINFDGTSGQKANSTWQPHLIRTKGSTIAFSIKGPITTTSNSSPMRSKEVG